MRDVRSVNVRPRAYPVTETEEVVSPHFASPSRPLGQESFGDDEGLDDEVPSLSLPSYPYAS